jgi:acetyl-CoA C-acetyltransferase
LNWPATSHACIKLQGKATEVAHDTHARISPVEVLAKLRAVHAGGVQTGGNSAALVDAAAAAVVASGAYAKAHGKKPLARVVAAAVVGVPPEIMGIGPAPAIRLLLERAGLTLDSHWPFRDQRSTGRTDPVRGARAGPGPEQAECERRRHRLGHPLAVHRRAPDADAGA